MSKNQYPSNRPFLKLARNHMRSWVKAQGLESIHPERVLIPDDAALNGKNFYNDEVWKFAQKRYPLVLHRGKSGKPRPLANDALRSEHIPFNFFTPLNRYLGSAELTKFLSEFASTQLTTVEQIEIEFPKTSANSMLSDNTSFDACFFAKNGSQKVVIGIEVKYTEGPYGWGKTEKQRMHDKTDVYIQLSEDVVEIQPGAYEHLRNRHLKQIWRNFLLGVSTANSLGVKFIYIHLFPEGNSHQASACKCFASHLTEIGRSVFIPQTYESFLELARNFLPRELSPWQEYLKDRYIFPLNTEDTVTL